MEHGQERKEGRIPRGAFGSGDLSSRVDDTARHSIPGRSSSPKLDDEVLEPPDLEAHRRVSTLVGMPSVPPEVLAAAREQRSSFPSPPSYDKLEQELSEVALRDTMLDPQNREAANHSQSTSEESQTELEIDVDIALPEDVLVPPSVLRSGESGADARHHAVRPPVVLPVMEPQDSLAPVIMAAPEVQAEGKEPSAIPWLLAAAVVLLGVIGWNETRGRSDELPRAPVQVPQAAAQAMPLMAAPPAASVETTSEGGDSEGAQPSSRTAPRSPRIASKRVRAVRESTSKARPHALEAVDKQAPSEDEVASQQVARPAVAPVRTPLADLPHRQDVQKAMVSARVAVAECVGDRSGRAQITARVVGSGKVTHVLVNGDFAGTRVGSCIARAVRTVSLPPFAHEQFEFTYPYAF